MGRSTLELCKPLFPEYSIPHLFLDCNIFLIKYVNFLTQGQSLPRKRFVLYYIWVAGVFVGFCCTLFPFVGSSAKLVVFTIYW